MHTTWRVTCACAVCTGAFVEPLVAGLWWRELRLPCKLACLVRKCLQAGLQTAANPHGRRRKHAGAQPSVALAHEDAGELATMQPRATSHAALPRMPGGSLPPINCAAMRLLRVSEAAAKVRSLTRLATQAMAF